jgi:hypothetical protein
MQQQVLFDDLASRRDEPIPLGSGLGIMFIGGVGKKAQKAVLYRQGVVVREASLREPVARRLFIVEAIEMGAGKTRLAKALGISRQTIHNHLETRKYFGIEGLIQGYDIAASKSHRKQRQLRGAQEGDKTRMAAEIRKKEREKLAGRPQQPMLLASCAEDLSGFVSSDAQPFAEEHEWELTRYAGNFVYLPTLISQWDWLRLVMRRFGESYRIFMVFLLMAAANIRSIEQLKNVRLREGGIVLGLRRIACKPKVWQWFYDAAALRSSCGLLTDFFRHQIRAGLVGTWLWFTDGHLLPYTGQDKVRSGYNTQRRMPVPGRTSMVTCDIDGRVVDFEIQEGKGDLRERIVALGKKWADDMPHRPVMVFDREGHGDEFFASLVAESIPFVTWEKHADSARLDVMEEIRFPTEFIFNGKQYGVGEEEKVISLPTRKDSSIKESMTLRRILVWNKTSKRRTCCLAWTTPESGMTAEDCARAILSRWGASENTFKHIKEHHPYHYHPGFKLSESERQDIANPEIAKMGKRISAIKQELGKLYKQLSRTKEALNADGSPRQNSVRERVRQAIAEQEAQQARLQEDKKHLPERVDASSLADYGSIKQIDNEGKYLFDFVTSSVWNARKQMLAWMGARSDQENEVVDLLYAITACHGWIRSSSTEVRVRLEPLQQPRRRHAQEQLCRRLTNLGTQTPNGKFLVIEVGEAPTPKRPKN